MGIRLKTPQYICAKSNNVRVSTGYSYNVFLNQISLLLFLRHTSMTIGVCAAQDNKANHYRRVL